MVEDRQFAPDLPDDADFETAVGDPAAYYASPQAVVADEDLSFSQKQRFLSEWVQDISDRQAAAGEGMAPDGPIADERDEALLQQLKACLEQLDTASPPATEAAGKAWWKRWGEA